MNSRPSADAEQPNSDLTLADGAHIAVIGGGPAGSFFSIHVLDAMQRAGRQLAITILEPKSFSTRGPAGCNKSAGIISPSLLANLDQSGLTLPSTVQMGCIGGFKLHLGGQVTTVPSPATDLLPATVYRGGGPKRADIKTGSSFDGWLFTEAVARGAKVIQQPVLQVNLTDACPQVQTPASTHTADLVVLASGSMATHPRCSVSTIGLLARR